MCGVVGAAFMSPLPDDTALQRAIQSLRHRGPDAQHAWRDQHCVLGHTRLAVIDLSPGAEQPMHSADGQAIVVFNGEIYNHHELRKTLERRGRRLRTRSDTEVIVEGYRELGAAVVEHLDGMFALAIYDRARQGVWLARDRVGKKPLYWTRANGGIVFGSSIAALEALGVAAPVDLARLEELMVLGYVPAPATLRLGVQQLEPAHAWWVDARFNTHPHRYWSAPFGQPRTRWSVEEATGRVRQAVERAVERRLEADVPLGAFLSGGIDSSIVVATMAKRMTHRVKTFSIGFHGDARFDETAYARLVAERFGAEHTEFTLDSSAFGLLDTLVAQHDGPFGDSSAIPTSEVARLTRQHVTVALGGDGGDELFAGYTRFLAAEAAEWVPSPLRQLGRGVAQALPAGQSERALYARARRFLGASSLPLSDRVLVWQTYFADPATVLRPELVSGTRPAWRWNREVFERGSRATPLGQILAHNFATYLPYDLMVKADRATMLHALELRSPFLDTALIELAAQLPDHLRRRGTTTKWILRRAFSDVLPDAILQRGKMGFGMPLGTWFRGPLAPLLRERLGDPGLKLFAYMQYRSVNRLLDEHADGRADHGHKLFLLLTLSTWLQSR